MYLNLEIDNCLRFDCRKKSNETLTHMIQGNLQNIKDEDIESSLTLGEKIINEKFSTSNNGRKIEANDFIEKLSHVILYRIEVPEGTDLNRYFEIMNTRGEQLEQHDILKAKFMETITSSTDREVFAKIWSACSNMNGYVQMNITDTNLRKHLFSDNWITLQQVFLNSENQDETKTFCRDTELTFNIKLQAILDNKPVEDANITEINEKTRFESIIDFPHFLLHVLRVFICVYKIDDFEVGKLIDDTLLLDEYKLLFKSRKAKQLNLSIEFINCLLKCRVLFDKYIIKREFAILDNNGKWSLKQINKGENDSPYYYTRTFQSDNILMLESAMRVSYTSPKIMHWITRLLIYFFSNYQINNLNINLELEIEKYIHESVKNFFTHDGYDHLGIDTPHIVLNYLDYLLWKENTTKYSDFVFEFRNTIEHWFPQHPSIDTFEKWQKEDVDNFGNICLLQRSYNSKFSNLEPHSKKASFSNMIAKGSIKLRIMSELTTENTDWKNEYKTFGEQMLKKLKDALDWKY